MTRLRWLTFAAGLLVCAMAQAVNLGSVRVFSQAGEPLRAEVALTGMTGTDGGAVRAALAPEDIFAASGLAYPPVLDSVKITVVRSGDGFALRLTTDQPVNDALLNPIIELTANGSTQLKAISVAIPGGRASKPAEPPPANVAPSAPLPPAPTAATAAPPWPVPAPGPAAAKPAPPLNTTAVAASVTEALRQELRSQTAGIASENEAVRKELKEAKDKIEALNGVVERMNQLVTTQQQIIDKQAGVQQVPSMLDGKPAGVPPAAAPAGAADAAPVVVDVREGRDPTYVIMAFAGLLVVGGLLAALLFGMRRRQTIICLPGPEQG